MTDGFGFEDAEALHPIPNSQMYFIELEVKQGGRTKYTCHLRG